jgi:N12 class adenine-specific DNA methylase
MFRIEELPSLENTMTESEKLEEFNIYKSRQEKQKLKHSAYVLQHVICECGCSVQRSNKSTHKKSNKHKQLLNALGSTQHQEKYDKLKEILKVALEFAQFQEKKSV